MFQAFLIENIKKQATGLRLTLRQYPVRKAILSQNQSQNQTQSQSQNLILMMMEVIMETPCPLANVETEFIIV